LIDKTKHSYLFVMVFKNVMPATLGNFQMFAFAKWISLKLGLINTKRASPEDDTIALIQEECSSTSKQSKHASKLSKSEK